MGTVAWVTSDSGGRSSGPWYASEPSTAPLPVVGSEPSKRSGPLRHVRRRKPRKLIIAAIAGALAVVAAIAAVVVVVSGGNGNTAGFVPTGSSAGQDTEQIAGAFLQAWQAGDLGQAARYTDHPAVAQAALASYQKYLHLRKLTAATQSSTAVSTSGTRGSVSYAISATVADSDGPQALSGTWSYHATLTAYQKPGSQAWYIAWQSGVLAPNLTSATHLAAVRVAPQVAGVRFGARISGRQAMYQTWEFGF